MHIFTATLGTETNTFSPLPTGLATFQERLLVPAGAHPAEPNLATGPLIAAREYVGDHGGTVTEGLCAFATPAGITSQRVYEQLRDQILDQLRDALPVDAVALGLHGAMVSEACQDCEGDLLLRVRELVGPEVCVGAELDLHCHVTEQMTDAADLLITYKQYPHIDFLDRGRELINLLSKMVHKEIKPHMEVYDCRMVGTFHTVREPMKSFVSKMESLEHEDGVLSISAAHGFPWGDVPSMGSKIIAITNADAQRAKSIATELGQALFKIRNQGTPGLISISSAIQKAMGSGKAPIVLADTSDNPGGGAPGDSTFVVKELIDQGAQEAVIGPIWDPIAVRLATEAGVGARLKLRIGGKVGPVSGDPLDLSVQVLAVCDKSVQRFGQSTDDLGASVAVRHKGIDLVLNTRRTQAFGVELFTNLGIDLNACQLIVVKSAQHFYAEFSRVAEEIIYMDGPGCVPRDITQLSYKNIPRPMWPFDDVK